LKRTRIPGLIDLINVDDAKEIVELNHDARIDRKFLPGPPLLNWLILTRSLRVLSFVGRRFPTMVSRDSTQRAACQTTLRDELTAKAESVREGREELEQLASWVRGQNPNAQVGLFVQQLVGQLFSPTFVATQESWRAARILVTAPRSKNWLQMFWWLATGKVRRAKRLLSSMVNGDLSAVNGIGIASHNIVNSLVQMRHLYADPAARSSLSAEGAVNRCLTPPVSLFRQATAAGELRGCPFSKYSLFVLAVGKASKSEFSRSLVFMDGSWSACPAAQWVPALLEGVWKRASAEHTCI
jgi:hypothetical protein